MKTLEEYIKDAVIYGYNLSINSSLAQKDIINYNFDTITKSFILKTVEDINASQRDTDLEACYESFIRSNHLSREWEKHYESWHNGEKQRDTEPKQEGKGAEEILKDFLDNNEAQDAEITGGQTYLSLPDVIILMKRASLPAKQSVSDERMNHMRNKALSVIELTKGFTTAPTDTAMITLLEFTDYILELTNTHSECNHVVGATDESDKCFKCGKTVSITTRYGKRES